MSPNGRTYLDWSQIRVSCPPSHDGSVNSSGTDSRLVLLLNQR